MVCGKLLELERRLVLVSLERYMIPDMFVLVFALVAGSEVVAVVVTGCGSNE